jgi:hypothetical protein
MPNFEPYQGDLIGLPTDDHHLNYRWVEPNCKVLFSVTRQGNGVSCHFASDKRGLFKIKRAIDAFANFVFEECKWCEVIFAKIESCKIERLIRRCGFEWLTNAGDVKIYIRRRPWAC